MDFQLTREKVIVISTDVVYAKYEELKREDVEGVLEWIKGQPHIPEVLDIWVMAFIHSAEYNLEEAKRMMENFLACKLHTPEMFKDMDPRSPDMIKAAGATCIGVLPTLTDDGCPILFSKLVDPAYFNIYSMVKLGLTSIFLCTLEKGLFDGYVIIIDGEGATMSHLIRIPISFFRRGIYMLQECMMVPIKAVHFINVSPVIEKMWSIIRPLLQARFVRLVKFHKGTNIFDHIPQRCLPVECGGTLATIAELQELFLERTQANYESIVDNEKVLPDVSKRMQPLRLDESYFGVEGQFRKLDID